VAPGDVAVTFDLTAMHPDPFAVHQRREHRRPAAGSLPDTEDVDVEFAEPIDQLVEVEIGCNDVIIVEQEHELGADRIHGDVAADSNTNVDVCWVDDLALRGGFGIRGKKSAFGLSIIDDDDVGLGDVLAQRLDQAVARPRAMNGLDAKGNVGRLHTCHQMLSICRPTRMTCR